MLFPTSDHRRAPSAAAVLLMLALAQFCLAGGEDAFTVTLPQQVYQAEEHGNVTLTVRYPASSTSPPPPLYIHLLRNKVPSIYRNSGKEGVTPYVDPRYKDRLLCRLQETSTGMTEFVISDLELADSGNYAVIVVVDGKSNSTHFRLNVKPAVVVPTEEDRPRSRGRPGLYASVGLVLVLMAGLCVWDCWNKWRERVVGESKSELPI